MILEMSYGNNYIVRSEFAYVSNDELLCYSTIQSANNYCFMKIKTKIPKYKNVDVVVIISNIIGC